MGRVNETTCFLVRYIILNLKHNDLNDNYMSQNQHKVTNMIEHISKGNLGYISYTCLFNRLMFGERLSVKFSRYTLPVY